MVRLTPVISSMAPIDRSAIGGIKYAKSSELGLGPLYSRPEDSYKEKGSECCQTHSVSSLYLYRGNDLPFLPLASACLGLQLLHLLLQVPDPPIPGLCCHRASFSRSLLSLFTFFSAPSIQLPHYLSCVTRSRPTTRHSNAIILVH